MNKNKYLAIKEVFVTYGEDKFGKVENMVVHNIGVDCKPHKQADLLVNRDYLEVRELLRWNNG